MKIKKNLFVIIGLLLLFSCKKEMENFSCNYYGTANTSSYIESIDTPHFNFSSNADAIKVVDLIVSQVGLTRNFEIIESNEVDNAAAVVYEEKRYILYNNRFMELANEITNNSWTSTSILAHEIGHHLQGHTLSKNGSRPSLELEADKFSGFILAKLGASLQDSQSAVQSLVSETSSETHPSRSKRLTAIAEGFREGVKNKSNQIENAIVPQTKTDNTELKEKQIIDSKKVDLSNNLIATGKHSFTIQWIGWERPGAVNVTKIGDNKFEIKGEQFSKETDDYLKIDGVITAISAKELIFNGTIKSLVSYINDGKECIRHGKQIFKANGNRKYWRLQNQTNCAGGMVTDYIDIFF